MLWFIKTIDDRFLFAGIMNLNAIEPYLSYPKDLTEVSTDAYVSNFTKQRMRTIELIRFI